MRSDVRHRKEIPMSSHSRALVYHLLATRSQVDKACIADTTRFDELGLDLLDVVLVVLRLEHFDRGDGDFPFAALEHATTVGDLVALVELWLQQDTVPDVSAHARKDRVA
jgi:acyl carrier protein